MESTNSLKSHFLNLFDYNNQINFSLLNQLKEYWNFLDEKPKDLLSHIINAHQIWNARILNHSQNKPWDKLSLELLPDLNSLNFINSKFIIENIELTQTISYRNTKGESFKNNISEILFHCINHSTYHRAQIATLLRNQKLEPLNTDYIFHKRTSYL